MRCTVARLPSAALILATTRSSICHGAIDASSFFPFWRMTIPIFLTVNFSPRFDMTPTQLPSCAGPCFGTACFAAAGLGVLCLPGTGCATAAPAPFRNNSNAMMVRLMLVPPLAMDVCRDFTKMAQAGIRFYQPATLWLHNCSEVLQKWHRDNRADRQSGARMDARLQIVWLSEWRRRDRDLRSSLSRTNARVARQPCSPGARCRTSAHGGGPDQ